MHPTDADHGFLTSEEQRVKMQTVRRYVSLKHALFLNGHNDPRFLVLYSTINEETCYVLLNDYDHFTTWCLFQAHDLILMSEVRCCACTEDGSVLPLVLFHEISPYMINYDAIIHRFEKLLAEEIQWPLRGSTGLHVIFVSQFCDILEAQLRD